MSDERSFRFPKPPRYDLDESVRLLALGSRDPSFCRIDRRGWQTLRWLDGHLCRVVIGCGSSLVGVTVQGETASLLDEQHARALLGLDDQPNWALSPRDPMSPYLRAHPGLRLVRAFWLYEAALNVVICQRVSGMEAALNWHRLCQRFGERRQGMSSAPSPQRLRGLTLAQLAACGIEQKRAVPLQEIARRLSGPVSIELDGDGVERLLSGCPRVGPWTRALLRGQFWADADAVPVGDYGLPCLVGQVLAGEREADDQRMLQLLEPYRGNRFRVIRYLWTDLSRRERRGPRLPIGQALGSG
jgi:3-methyladenine DNA glycosylase/8-oxoguanine DNA glycosylase